MINLISYIILSLSVICGLSAVALLLSRYYQQTRMLQQQLDELKKEVATLRTADLTLATQLRRITTDIYSIDERQEKIEHAQVNDSAYSQALKLAEMGASTDELIKTCKISKAEADLLQSLNAYKTLINPTQSLPSDK